jgi:hypothetical protein
MAITPALGEKILSNALLGTLKTLGFEERERLIFVRGQHPERWIMLPVRVENGTTFMCSMNLGIRFERLEPLLYPDSPGPTILMPIHLLTHERNWTEWAFRNEEEAHALVPTLLSWIERLADPFWAKYSDLSNIKVTLQSPNPADWFVLSETQRIALLAAIQYIEGNGDGAVQYLDEIISNNKSKLPKYWLPLKRLRDRIQPGVQNKQ